MLQLYIYDVRVNMSLHIYMHVCNEVRVYACMSSRMYLSVCPYVHSFICVRIEIESNSIPPRNNIIVVRFFRGKHSTCSQDCSTFSGFLKLLDLFRPIRICSDLLSCVWIHSSAFGSVSTLLNQT